MDVRTWKRTLVLGLAALLVTADSAAAHSQRAPPLNARAVSHPSDLAIRVVRRSPASSSNKVPEAHQKRAIKKRAHEPAQRWTPCGGGEDHEAPAEVAWDDRFLLKFAAHEREVTMSLRPSRFLMHPSGIKSIETHTAADGTRTTTTTQLGQEDVRAYEGWVLNEGEDLEQWIKEEEAGIVRYHDPARHGGWARIVLPTADEQADPTAPFDFQGSFSVDDEIYTIMSTRRYLHTRHEQDPEPPMLLKRGLWDYPSTIVVRESDTADVAGSSQALYERQYSEDDFEEISCGHDALPFNTNSSHPVYGASSMHADWAAHVSPLAYSVFGLPSSDPPTGPRYPPRLGRRQMGGDVASTGQTSSNFASSIGSTAGCPKQQRVVFTGVAADCTYVNAYGSADAARTQILTDFNSVSALYAQTFNVSVGIVELNVQAGACPTTTSAVDSGNPWNVGCEEGGGPGLDLNSRLSVFSAWRGAKGGSDGAGLWHLMTNCSSGSEVGVAWLGQLCKVTASTNDGQTASGTGVTAITRAEWQVIAHETGHSFGAIHDCAAGCTSSQVCCPLSSSSCDASANFIMSPVSTKNVSTFSPCSIGNICTTLANSLNTSCLATPGASSNPPLISLQSCGNGIVEDDEECDPGSQEDSCCNRETCRFRSGAVCSPLNAGCCTSSCQVASAGTVCRASVDATCDIQETCSGTNSTCPTDTYQPDGTSCGGGSLACASGVCTSRDLQCQTAGASLRIRSACPSRASGGCSITCADPTSSADCVILDQSFRDGTPCGYGGVCRDNSCAAGSPLNVATSWYRQNLQISIPVTIVAAIIVFGILTCIFRSCCRRAKANKVAKMPPSMRYAPQNNLAAVPPAASVGRRLSSVPGRLTRGNRNSGSHLAPPATNSGRGSTSSVDSGRNLIPPAAAAGGARRQPPPVPPSRQSHRRMPTQPSDNYSYGNGGYAPPMGPPPGQGMPTSQSYPNFNSNYQYAPPPGAPSFPPQPQTTWGPPPRRN